MPNQNQTARKYNGQYTHSKAKDTIAILGTAFIVTCTAYYGLQLTPVEAQQLIESAEPLNPPASHCLLTGQGTGNLTSYCADTPERLAEVIKGLELNPPKPVEAVKTPPAVTTARVTGYKRKHFDPAIAEIIKNEALKQGYSNLELAYDLVDCESTWNPRAKNTAGNTPKGSADLGLWQYNDYWQRKNLTQECMLDIECSTRQAIKDLKAGKAGQWACYRIVR